MVDHRQIQRSKKGACYSREKGELGGAVITGGHWRSRGSKVRRLLGAGPLRSLIGWAVGSGGKLSSSCRMGRSDAFLLGMEGVVCSHLG